MGSSVSSSYTPISTGATNNVISALGRDNELRTDGELSYLTQGAAPNRTLTVQWKNYQHYTTGTTNNGNIFNFQIVLYETSNVVEVRYGAFTVALTPCTNPQVGLRGGSSSDYSNRTGSNWAASTAGASNSATMTLSTSAFPASGQTYTWTPASGPPGCAINPSPANAATGVSKNTTLSWSAGPGGAPTNYDVYFGTSVAPPFVANVAASPYNPGTLPYSTLHYWQIVPKNGSGSATGCPVWSFTTEPDPTITPPWLEPFVTYPPTNWTEATGLLAAPTTLSGTSSNWTADGFANVGTTGSAKLNIWSTTIKDWMFTPPVNLGSGMNYQLEFDLALTPFGATGPATLGVDDKFAVVISTDGGATWTSANTLQLWTSGTPISNTGDHITINLASYSGVVKFGFYGESTVSNADNDLFVDNVQVRQPPAGPPGCAINPSPADTATDVSISTSLGWSAGLSGGTPTSYDVYFGTSGSPPFVANVAASPYNPGVLPYSTLHYWQIVPKNASGSASGCPVWSFTTAADPTVTAFPYSQDFNGASFPGWTQENTNADGNVWAVQTTYRRGTSGGAAAVHWNVTLAMDDWLFTPPLQLTGGVTYGVRFFYRAASATFPEKMEVKWGSTASSAGMTNGPIFDDPAIVNTTMKEAIATFTPAASGIYYVGFHGYSDPDEFYLVVDDVTVYNTADSTWQWQGGTSNDWFVNGNWEGAIVPGELDLVEIPVVAEAPNANSPLIGSSSETSYGKVNNLTVDAGATLELATNHNLKVQGALTNNGTLKQIKAVSLGSPTVFLNITDGASPTPVNKYFGVEINPTSINMGNTTVTVSGNQQCREVVNTDDQALLRRAADHAGRGRHQVLLQRGRDDADRPAAGQPERLELPHRRLERRDPRHGQRHVRQRRHQLLRTGHRHRHLQPLCRRPQLFPWRSLWPPSARRAKATGSWSPGRRSARSTTPASTSIAQMTPPVRPDLAGLRAFPGARQHGRASPTVTTRRSSPARPTGTAGGRQPERSDDAARAGQRDGQRADGGDAERDQRRRRQDGCSAAGQGTANAAGMAGQQRSGAL